MRQTHRVILLGIAVIVAAAFALHAADEAIDWNKARQLHQKATSGQKLSAEEQAYYDRARAARGQGQPGSDAKGKKGAPEMKAAPSVGLVPLPDMKASQNYKGEDGGLYGKGLNTPPAEHLKHAMDAAASIKPLDASGNPSAAGKIVMITHGMSNTTMESQAFLKLANADGHKNPSLVLVDCAIGGVDSRKWLAGADDKRGTKPWDTLDDRIKSAGVTPQQVQVVWMKHAMISPAQYGEFPKHAQELTKDEVVIVHMLKERFPNLRLLYASSRTYAGWATSNLNPEPYSYEGAFSTRWLIQDQIEGKSPQLAYGKAPVILWGPYLWTDGEKGRKVDQLVWKHEDVVEKDGTHPSDSGRRKVGEQLLKFFTTDPTAKGWFTKS